MDEEKIIEVNTYQLEKFKKEMNILYKKKVSDKVDVFVGQLLINNYGYNIKRSHYLAMLIVDNRTNRHIMLRLSSVRKIIKFLISKDFDVPRRLGFFEKLKLNKTYDETCEDLVPGYRKDKKAQQAQAVQERIDEEKKKLEIYEAQEKKHKKKVEADIRKLEKRKDKIEGIEK